MFRRIGWQVLLVGVGFLVSAVILAYIATTYTTEFRPARGGTYVESVGGYPQSLNPLLSFYNDADSDVVALTFSGLTRIGMRGDMEPDLAGSDDEDPHGPPILSLSLDSVMGIHEGEHKSKNGPRIVFMTRKRLTVGAEPRITHEGVLSTLWKTWRGGLPNENRSCRSRGRGVRGRSRRARGGVRTA